MTIPNLGTLSDVNPREAWGHEAMNFTPWLAANLEMLGDKIGIRIELEGQEVPVETFSADILARNSIDDSLVLIENQLEGSDHKHLGQIMTYLAGLDAHTVVWIATDFREAHLSALKWLNENTTDSFSFFAVKVRAVRIGDSPIAPVFEVLEKPNQWERKLQAVAKDTGSSSEIGQLRYDFWTHYVNRFPDELQRNPAHATNARWRTLDALGLVVAIFIAKGYVGVYIRGLRKALPEDTYARLEPHATKLEARLERTIGNPGATFLFNRSYSGDTSNRENWDDLMDWMHSTADTYESALTELLGGQD